MKVLTLSCILLLLVNSCNWFYGVENLGSGYYFHTNKIVYTDKGTYNGYSFSAIPPRVIAYKSNNDFIIVRSKNNFNIEVNWLVIKNEKKEKIRLYEDDSIFSRFYVYSNIIGPLGDNEFKEIRLKYNVPVNLIFSEVPKNQY